MRHGLLGEKKYAGKQGIAAFTQSCGCVQFDPIDVCGQNALLTYQSRVADFSAQQLNEALYQDRALIDYFDKNLSILSAQDWPHLTRTRKKYQKGGRSFQEIAGVRSNILSRLDQNPCVCSADLPMQEKVHWYWSATTLARAALEQLYFEGELIIHHKEGSRKYYAPARKHFPKELLDAPDPYETDFDYLCTQVLRRIGAVGLLPCGASDAYLCIDNLKGDLRKKVFDHLLAQRKILEVQIESLTRPLYMTARDAPLLEEIHSPHTPRTELIAPLDPFIWDRKVILSLFDFDYKWEIYTPKEKRRYGYYVLPVLQGDRLVGRIEPVYDKKSQKLHIEGFWPEDGALIDEERLQKAVYRLEQILGGRYD